MTPDDRDRRRGRLREHLDHLDWLAKLAASPVVKASIRNLRAEVEAELSKLERGCWACGETVVYDPCPAPTLDDEAIIG